MRPAPIGRAKFLRAAPHHLRHVGMKRVSPVETLDEPEFKAWRRGESQCVRRQRPGGERIEPPGPQASAGVTHEGQIVRVVIWPVEGRPVVAATTVHAIDPDREEALAVWLHQPGDAPIADNAPPGYRGAGIAGGVGGAGVGHAAAQRGEGQKRQKRGDRRSAHSGSC